MIEARATEYRPAAADAARVCIAIPTFRRPESLRALLRGVAVQVIPSGFSVEVLVVDNDSRPSAEHLVRGMIDGFPFALAYSHVAEPGLSSVRNFILSYARDRFAFLAMIDDDEYPEPQWLHELLRVQSATDADAVIGSVPPALPAEAPRWIRSGSFFDLPSPPDGSSIRFGYSGNCLLCLSSLARYRVTFDSALNFAGGEDLLFFRQLIVRGATLVYAAKAIAHETIGSDRLRASYLLRLNFRRGNTLSICDRRLNGNAIGLLTRALKSNARVAFGLLSLLPLAATRGRAGVVLALCDIARGLGALCGLAGHTYNAYERKNVAGG
jgi:succinoglycan biosynthesis protein ExoM